MQTITLQYYNPEFPEHQFLFYELCERFTKDKRENEKLGYIRKQLNNLWKFGNSEDYKDFVSQYMELDQKKGIVEVRV